MTMSEVMKVLGGAVQRLVRICVQGKLNSCCVFGEFDNYEDFFVESGRKRPRSGQIISMQSK